MIVSLRFNRMKDSVKIELAKEPRPSSENETETAVEPSEETPTQSPAPRPELRQETTDRPQGKLPPILSPTTYAETESTPSPGPIDEAVNAAGNDLPAAVAYSSPSSGIIGGFARWMIGLFLLVVVGTLVLLHFRKSPPVYISEDQPLALMEDRKQSLVKALASQLTQTLFRQRQELLKSKEEATAQVEAMENRLAKLQPEIFDKLAAYEKKIKQLEAQLRARGVTPEEMNQPLEDEVARPIFDDLKASAEGEENLETSSETEVVDVEDDKEVPFPGHVVADDLDEDGPSDLLEEVMEDLEAEDNFDKRIAKGSDRAKA